MRIRVAIQALNLLHDNGIIDSYAIGGAVAATFYIEVAATLDIDFFVDIKASAAKVILDPSPILAALRDQGYEMEGEYVMIAGWPVQLLTPGTPLVRDALDNAIPMDVDGVPTRIFSSEHLAAICLETGKPKDQARLLQFIEEAAVDAHAFESLIDRFGLRERWKRFRERFLGGNE